MKKVFFYLMAAAGLLALASCEEKVEPVQLYDVSVQLKFYNNLEESIYGNFPVTLSSATASFNATSNRYGVASFHVPAGAYTASVSFKIAGINLNGSSQEFVVDAEYNPEEPVAIPVIASKASALIIKELYTGGCKKDDGSNYFNDKYVIIYNNSAEEVDASRMCIGMGAISNLQSTNKYPENADGIAEFEVAGWSPACNSIWWFQNGTEVKIPAYSQIIVSITGAIDHTVTYKNSVNLSGADYVFYDKESGYTGSAQYPAPAEGIDASHYMKTYRFGIGTAWSIGTNSAGLFLLIPDNGVDITAWVKNDSNFDNRGINASTKFGKLPISWVKDAVDVWQEDDATKYYSRFPKAINVGHLLGETGSGYTEYRNVDKEATEAIAENEGKLVYGYDGAADPDASDPSGIDAEASIANGAKIVYMDTNNANVDFHVRKVASLKK
ncbi:MAG: DUF4876 domain-containing protein [Bacteroidales bacterium]|nr:DUF4876 domain-containing protein [Bacteroidales bacterium]